MSKQTGHTIYSITIQGDVHNHSLPARFDLTDGYLGISQDTRPHTERVLLSPTQIKALLRFLKKSREGAR